VSAIAVLFVRDFYCLILPWEEAKIQLTVTVTVTVPVTMTVTVTVTVTVTMLPAGSIQRPTDFKRPWSLRVHLMCVFVIASMYLYLCVFSIVFDLAACGGYPASKLN